MHSPKIKLYSVTTCIYCQSIKKILATFDVPFESADADLLSGVDRVALLAELRGINPRCSFPTLAVGERIITGFKVQEILDALGVCTEVGQSPDRQK